MPKGAEITRGTPPGHFNAIFLDDITPLDTEEFTDAIKAANQQGAFVFWNHPGLKEPGSKLWVEVHLKIYENKWLHGIEVVNGNSYYPNAHQWCLDKNLTMMGNSDIHYPSMIQKTTSRDHRSITLVFAKDKSIAAIKEALFAGRTVVWCQNQLIGRKKFLDAIFWASVEIGKPYRQIDNTIWFEIKNKSAIDIELEWADRQDPNNTEVFSNITLLANGTVVSKIKVDEKTGQAKLSYIAKNFLIAPETGLPVEQVIPEK